MNKIEYFWNAVYYMLWKGDLWHSLIFQKCFEKFILPLIPKIFWTKAMRNPQIVVEYYKQKDRGPCHWIAANCLNGIAIAYSFPLMGCVYGLLIRWNLDHAAYWLSTPILFISWYISDRLALHNKRFLVFFPEFEKKPKSWKCKWALITSVLCLGALPMLYVFILIVDFIYHI